MIRFMQDVQADEQFVGCAKVPGDGGGDELFFGQDFHEIPGFFFTMLGGYEFPANRDQCFTRVFINGLVEGWHVL